MTEIWETVANEADGWLHPAEGPALHRHAASVAHLGPLAEIGGYAGKSACWIGSVAKEHDTVLFSVDWHRGSPEMAEGRECHHPQMVGRDGVFDTISHFRENIRKAELEPWVVPVIGDSPRVGRYWNTSFAFLFIDGAHDGPGVLADYTLWNRHVLPGGIFAFHDTTIPEIGVVADSAVSGGDFAFVEQIDSLRILRCVR